MIGMIARAEGFGDWVNRMLVGPSALPMMPRVVPGDGFGFMLVKMRRRINWERM